jgi:hypothetical protein
MGNSAVRLTYNNGDLEIEVASASINKMEICRALKVPELWRIHADGSCAMFLLQTDFTYAPIQSSSALPIFNPSMISHFLLLREELGHSEAVRRFDAEVLSNLNV